MAEYSDNFDRADTTPTASAGDGLGSGWNAPQYRIDTNTAVRGTGGSGTDDFARFLTDLGSPDHWVEADVDRLDAYLLVNARNSGALGTNCYLGFIDPATDIPTIGKVVSGSYSNVLVGSTPVAAGECTLRLEVQGTAIRLYRNDVLVLSTTDGDLTTGNFVGLNASANSSANFDNFVAGDFVTGTNLVVADGAHAHSADNVVLTTDTAAVVTTSTEGSTSLGSNNAIPAPTGVASGNLLLAFCSNDNTSTTAITASTGWTQVTTVTLGSNVHKMAVFGRVADGGANDSLSLSGATQDYAAAILRIVNHGVTTVSTDVKVATTSNTTAGSIDPPSLDAGSSRTWLWLAAGCADLTNAADSVSAVPTNYTQVINLKSASSTSSSVLAVASRGVSAQTQDPGAFTNTSRQWIGITVAVPPLVAVTDLEDVDDAVHDHTATGLLDLVQTHELDVDDTVHDHTAENLDLVQQNVLEVAAAVHDHTADNLDLVQQHDLDVDGAVHDHTTDVVGVGVTLTVDDTAHAHAADVVALVVDLVLGDAVHDHTADGLDLVQQHVLTANDAVHAHSAGDVVLVLDVTVASALHGHSADNLDLVQASDLAVSDCLHAHGAEEVALSTDDTLGVQSALHTHSAENLDLVQAHNLAVADAVHDHNAATVTLTIPDVDLEVGDAFHVHEADDVVFGLIGLVVNGAVHAHSADTIALDYIAQLVVADCLHAHQATGDFEFPPDFAPGDVVTYVLVDQVDAVVIVDVVDVTLIGGNL